MSSHGARMLAASMPVPLTEQAVRDQLTRGEYALGPAEAVGDCFLLLVLRGAGQITAAQAKDPDDETMTKINLLRVAAVELITGTAPIGGMDPSVVRDQQKLPTDSAEATREMAGWREGRHWWTPLAQRHQSADFMFAVAVIIGIRVN